VAAEKLLERVAAERNGRSLTVILQDVTRSRAWSFLDFSMDDDVEFVQQAHFGLLDRPPCSAELDRHLSNIAHGATRAEILLRVMLSPEGRRRRPTVRGVLLPAFLFAATSLDRLRPARPLPSQALAPRAESSLNLAAIDLPPLLPPRLVSPLQRAYRQIRKIPLLGAVAETVVDLTRLRRLRYEVIELRREIECLRARSGP
jgi:hypothetical protein